MSSVGFDDPDAFWRHCEDAWMRRLLDDGYAVTRLTDAQGNKVGTAAPMTSFGGLWLRSPDLLATKDGAARYWEVKYRSAPGLNPDTGVAEYWMDYAAFTHYVALDASGTEVHIALYDRSAERSACPWYSASIKAVLSLGHRTVRNGLDGAEVDAWAWPSAAMSDADAPPVDFDAPLAPNAPAAGGTSEPSLTALPLGEPTLDQLCSKLGIPVPPRYSVLCVAPQPGEVDDVLEFLRYGIRVFLVAGPELETRRHTEEQLSAYRQARLLEWSCVPGLRERTAWFVDGICGLDDETEQLLVRADDAGGFNLEQYRVVHADSSADYLVIAGAGTGKTETMVERLVFLLATSEDNMGADDAVLVTFTRESASEMRRRIARSMVLRIRLCDRLVLPVLEWVLQLGAADIDTIHTYAKTIVQRGGSRIGVSPGFSVGERVLDFRRLIRRAVSTPLAAQFRAARHPNQVPAEHELVEFVETLWAALSRNGLSPLTLTASPRVQPDWGPAPPALSGAIVAMVRQIVSDVARDFATECLESQTLPVDELVATAISTVAAGGMIPQLPRYVFVDEFQDTDAEQMAFLLALRDLGVRLFVVGDPNQGIYRFRGAQGDAFESLGLRTAAAPLTRFNLTRNFRSGKTLLDSLHPFFLAWGDAQDGGEEFLSYSTESRLRDSGGEADESLAVQVRSVGADAARLAELVHTVQGWVAVADETVGILCRFNRDAAEVREALRGEGITCELRVGGDFFRSPAVREARALLEAVLNPQDDAALLELTTTRWFGGIADSYASSLGGIVEARWPNPLPQVLSWGERLSRLRARNSFERRDIAALRERVMLMATSLRARPTLAWLSEWSSDLRLRSRALPGDDKLELPRYVRCLDHLLTVMDASFADSPVSPISVLDWLKVQIATNYAEDEPAPPESGPVARVTALTVHKAKGLEFDRVIVAKTDDAFNTYRSEKVAVLPRDGAEPQLVWKWQFKKGPEVMSRSDSAALWAQDSEERVKEEARLLYVAMTRARRELVILKSARVRDGRPQRWSDFL